MQFSKTKCCWCWQVNCCCQSAAWQYEQRERAGGRVGWRSKRDTFTAFRSSFAKLFLQLIVLLERFLGSPHTHAYSAVYRTLYWPRLLLRAPICSLSSYPPPCYISVSNPKMFENFCTTSIRTLHLLKTRTDEIEKPCLRDDVRGLGKWRGAKGRENNGINCQA